MIMDDATIVRGDGRFQFSTSIVTGGTKWVYQAFSDSNQYAAAGPWTWRISAWVPASTRTNVSNGARWKIGIYDKSGGSITINAAHIWFDGYRS